MFRALLYLYLYSWLDVHIWKMLKFGCATHANWNPKQTVVPSISHTLAAAHSAKWNVFMRVNWFEFQPSRHLRNKFTRRPNTNCGTLIALGNFKFQNAQAPRLLSRTLIWQHSINRMLIWNETNCCVSNLNKFEFNWPTQTFKNSHELETLRCGALAHNGWCLLAPTRWLTNTIGGIRSGIVDESCFQLIHD